jgi:hypothetical protein
LLYSFCLAWNLALVPGVGGMHPDSRTADLDCCSTKTCTLSTQASVSQDALLCDSSVLYPGIRRGALVAKG